MTEFKTIPLSEIHPDKNQPRKFFDESALRELTESVKLKGVIQPIMVRPNGSGYILVCGERRYKASTAAGLIDVPAVIRHLTDEEALEIQFIENIQRDDVHPMDEASTFKAMLESKIHPYTIADIAAKINKPEKFVTHRLSLNNLIPDLQQDFWKGKFLIGHAVLFSKLSAEDQKICLKECEERIWLAGDKSVKTYKSIEEVKGFISRNIMQVLSSAPFKKDDPTLNPEMGACTSCPFRSGNNPTLFDEVKETDRCFKPACFEKKIVVNLVRSVKTVLEEQPETMLLSVSYGRETNKEVERLINAFNVKPIKEYHDFGSHVTKGDTRVKGLWINGSDAGKFAHVALKKNSKAAATMSSDGKPSSSAIDIEIAGIKERTKRAAELDDEKVWLRIHKEILKDDESGKALINDKPLSKIDTTALLFALYKRINSGSAEIAKMFEASSGYMGNKEELKFAKKLLDATPKQVSQVCRIFFTSILDSTMSSHTANAGQGLLKQVAEQYFKEEITSYELEQQEKRETREVRAAQRIKALQEQKKPTSVKKIAATKSIDKTKKHGQQKEEIH